MKKKRLLVLLLSYYSILNLWGTEPLTLDPLLPELLLLPTQLQYDYLRETQKGELSSTENPQQPQSSILAAIKLVSGSKQKLFWMKLRLQATEQVNTKKNVGTLYTSTGRRFVFESINASLQSTLYGKINPKRLQNTPVKTFNIDVNKDYLELGLNELHHFFKAVERYREKYPDGEKMSYTIQSSPFTDNTLLFPPEVLEVAQLSLASERAFVGALPALNEFFKIIYETDGLKELLLELIPRKTLLRLLNPFSQKGIHFSYGNPAPYVMNASPFQLGLETVGAIPVVLTFDGKPMLNLMFYTTTPSYEWNACAGVVAMSVESVEKKEHKCFVRAFPESMIRGRIKQDTE